MNRARCTESGRQTAAVLTLCSGDQREKLTHKQGLENKEILEGETRLMGRAQRAEGRPENQLVKRSIQTQRLWVENVWE